MNYRHIYHAGNFADVFKHAVLCLLLQALRRKDTPFCYIDTHAGAGRYDLTRAEARETGEFRDGIQRLWDGDPVPSLTDYLAAVAALNPGPELRLYPGSPRIARHFLRPQDRAVLLELHPQEHAQLKSEFAGDPQVRVLCQDGYDGLKALLPPRERRGLVLIDPPYESAAETRRAVQGMQSAYDRWPTGHYALWYPIKTRAAVEQLHRLMRESGLRKVVAAECCPYPADSDWRLNGCGLILINPPWRLEEQLNKLTEELLTRLRRHPTGRAELIALVPE